MDNAAAEHNLATQLFIKKHPCAVLATQSDGGVVSLANVYAHIDDNFFLYIVSRPEHRKFKNIGEHPQVTLMFVDQENVEQVEYTGTAMLVEAVDTVADLLPEIQKVLIEQRTEYWIPPVSQLNAEGYVVIKIVPDKIVRRTYAKGGTAADMNEAEVNLETLL